jgi:hypothetical protein
MMPHSSDSSELRKAKLAAITTRSGFAPREDITISYYPLSKFAVFVSVADGHH